MARVYEAEATIGMSGCHAAPWRALRASLHRSTSALAAIGLFAIFAALPACSGAPEPATGPGTPQAIPGNVGSASIEGGVLTPAMLFPPGPAELLLRSREKGRVGEWASERRTTSARDADGRWTLTFEVRSSADGPWKEVRRLGLEIGPAGGVCMRTLRDAERKTQLTFTPPIEIFPASLGPGTTTNSRADVESFDLDSQGEPKGRPSRGAAAHTTEHAGRADGAETIIATLRLELSGAVVTRQRRSGYGDGALVREREELTVKVGPFTVDRSVRELER